MVWQNYNPKRLLKGEVPRLIDEWQLAPKLWDAIRFEVDHRGELGQFILTGSAVPADMKEITHSGTGRFIWLTMSLYESGDSKNCLMVLTGTGDYAYRRHDGVFVVPIGCLKN